MTQPASPDPEPKATRRKRVERGVYIRADRQGKRVYEIGYRDNDGRQRWETVPGGLRAARHRYNEIAAQRHRGEDVRPNPRIHFGEAADHYWHTKAIRLAPNTQNAYGASLKHLRARWDRTRLDNIPASAVASFIAEMESRGYAGWTIRGALTVLGRIFDHASRYLGWRGRNPVRELDRDERPKSDGRPMRILTPDELRRLLDALEPEYRLLFEFAATTGARLGEVLGVLWRDLDLKASTATFTHQLDRRGQRVPLKTKRSRRTIELPPTIAARLSRHRMISDHPRNLDYVFASRQGKGYDHRNIAGRVLHRAASRAGLAAKRQCHTRAQPALTFHSLRHTHGSALIATGWDIEEVSSRLGHRDSAITASVYVHAYDVTRRTAERKQRLDTNYERVLAYATPEDRDAQPMTLFQAILR